MKKRIKREIEARQQLEAVLGSGEELLAYTRGTIAGVMTSKPLHLGLTQERLILLLLKRGKPSQVLSIWRENLTSLKWSGLWDRLKIGLARDQLSVTCGGRGWKRRAKDLVNLHRQTPIPQRGVGLANQRQLEQARAFRELGLIASAQEISQHVQPELASGTGTPTASLSEALVEKRLALRVGAAFLVINVVVGFLLTALLALAGADVQPLQLVSAVIDCIIGVNLWKGRAGQWEKWALIRAVGGFVIYGLISLINGAIIDLVLQAALSGSLVLVLAGESKRTRTWIAIGVYAVLYVGLLFVYLLGAFLYGLISAAL